MNLLNNDIDLFESILFLYLETRLEMEAEQSKEERVTSMMSNLSLETTPPASLLKTKINEIEIEAKLLIFGGWETPVWVSLALYRAAALPMQRLDQDAVNKDQFWEQYGVGGQIR
jgi:hypothetical protein